MPALHLRRWLRIASLPAALLVTHGLGQAAEEPGSADAEPTQAAAPATLPGVAEPPAAEAPGVANVAQVFEGRVAYYARRFVGRRTASGERHSASALTMAHLTLPLGTLVRVTNLATRRSVVVRVNDRGPYTRGRIADVSEAAARALQMLRPGVVMARLEVLR